MKRIKIDLLSDWDQLGQRLYLSRRWLSKGLVVVSRHPDFNHYAEKTKLQVNQTATLKYRQITIDQSDGEIQEEEIISSTESSPREFSSIEKVKPRVSSVLDYFSVLQTAVQQKHLPIPFTFEKKVYFENTENKDIFIPVSFYNAKMQAVRFYFSLPLDLTSNGDFSAKFKGIKVFVTAGCMFGTALQGFDRKGAPVPIIQHKINFVEGEQITSIDFLGEELHPYEIAQFSFLKDILPLMEKISAKDERPQLIYHLPNFDYILSIIKLFIQNKISYEALLDGYAAVKKRSQKHIEKLKSIFKNSTINLSIESPFMNLLKDFFVEGNYEIIWLKNLIDFEQVLVGENKIYVTIKDKKLTYKILSPSGIEESITDIEYAVEELSPENINEITVQLLKFIDGKGHVRGMNAFLRILGIPIQRKPFAYQKELERTVVARILKILSENEISIRHQTIWTDLAKMNSGKDRVNSLEALFKIANAMMIARAAKGESDYAVCSLLPLNEKPIFTKYLTCTEKLAQHEVYYPKVLPLVALERLICYSRRAKGNAFHFDSSSKLAEHISQDALTNPREHFGFFSDQHKKNVFSRQKVAGLNEANTGRTLYRNLSF